MEEKQKKLCLEYTNMNQQISCVKEQTAKNYNHAATGNIQAKSMAVFK